MHLEEEDEIPPEDPVARLAQLRAAEAAKLAPSHSAVAVGEPEKQFSRRRAKGGPLDTSDSMEICGSDIKSTRAGGPPETSQTKVQPVQPASTKWLSSHFGEC